MIVIAAMSGLINFGDHELDGVKGAFMYRLKSTLLDICGVSFWLFTLMKLFPLEKQ
jgi:hypothetical protein